MMYPGWRAKIGFILPSAGAGNFFYEKQILLPRGVSCVSALSYIDKMNPEGLRHYVDQVVGEARKLKSAEVDLIEAAGTPTALYAEGFDSSIIKSIQDETGIPATTSLTCVLEALGHVGAKKIAVGTAYSDEVNRVLESVLSQKGFRVSAIKGLGLLRNVEGTKLPESVMYKLGREVFALANKECDTIYLSGPVPVLGIIQDLEDDLGVTVVASRAAEVFTPLKMLGIKSSLKGYGRLLSGE